MKRVIFFLLLLPLINACSPGKETSKDILKRFKTDGYNMSPLKRTVYGAIKFQLPETMEVDYSSTYAYKSTAFTRREYNLGILFSVERFTEGDLYSELMTDYPVVGDDFLNGFHDAYVNRRLESLYQGGTTFKKDVSKKVKFPGTIQVISGQSSEGYNFLYYVTSTLKVDKDYYIFQFICEKEMMDYVFDDFERILASVRKK